MVWRLDLLDQSSFDLVLCDYGLPGLNGGEVLQRIKSRWPDLPRGDHIRLVRANDRGPASAGRISAQSPSA